MSSPVSLEAMLFWRLFADGNIRFHCLGNFVEQQSCTTKLLDFVACLTWALHNSINSSRNDTFSPTVNQPLPMGLISRRFIGSLDLFSNAFSLSISRNSKTSFPQPLADKELTRTLQPNTVLFFTSFQVFIRILYSDQY